MKCNATVTVAYRSRGLTQACWYVGVYNGATLLGTHGSSGSPISCQTGNTAFKTDVVTLSEVTTPAQANNLSYRIYMKESASDRTDLDVVTTGVTYYLN